MQSRLAIAAILVALHAQASAAPARFLLGPERTLLQFRAYALNMFPIDGSFQRFNGTIALDAANPAFCDVQLAAAANSLQMSSENMTAEAQGPDLLDVERFPNFRFDGACDGGQLHGTLLLHGVEKPVSLAVTRSGGRWQAQGTIMRADWGMGARPLAAGPGVQITLALGLPAGY